MFLLFFQFLFLFFISCVLKILIEDFLSPVIKILIKIYKLPLDLFFIIFFALLKSLPELIYSSLWALLSPSSTTLPYKATSIGSGISLFAIFSSSMIAFGFIQPLCVLICNSNRPHNKYYEKKTVDNDIQDELTLSNTSFNSSKFSTHSSSSSFSNTNLNIIGSLSNEYIPSRRKNKKKYEEKFNNTSSSSTFLPLDNNINPLTSTSTSIPLNIDENSKDKYNEKKNIIQKFKNFLNLIKSKFLKNNTNNLNSSSSLDNNISSSTSSSSSFFLSFIKPKYINTQIQRNPSSLFSSIYSIKKEIKLEIRPLLRETFFFISILLLFVYFMSDRFLDFHEALILFFCFLVYCFVLIIEVLMTREVSMTEEKLDMSNLHSINSDLPQFHDEGLNNFNIPNNNINENFNNNPSYNESNSHAFPLHLSDSPFLLNKKRRNSNSTHESYSDYSDYSDDLESEIPNFALMSEDIQDISHPSLRNKLMARTSNMLNDIVLTPIRQVLSTFIPSVNNPTSSYSQLSTIDSSFNELNSLYSNNSSNESQLTQRKDTKDGSIITSVFYSIIAVPDPKKEMNNLPNNNKDNNAETPLSTSTSTIDSPIHPKDPIDKSLSSYSVQNNSIDNINLQFSNVNLLNSPNDLVLNFSSKHSKIKLFSIFFICLGVFTVCSFLIHIICKSLSVRFQSRSSVIAAIILVLCSEVIIIFIINLFNFH